MLKKSKKNINDVTPADDGRNPQLPRILLSILTVLVLLAALLFWLFPAVSLPQLPSMDKKIVEPTAKSVNHSTMLDKHDEQQQFVDNETCKGCHAEQFKQWQSSHHHLAMQEANDKTVLGDFNNASFTDDKEPSRFFRKDNAFWINTIGADGKAADFKVAFTLGVEPLQQYLLELPGGRLQPFNVAWDTQKKRWFHLYPKQGMDFNDPLHWSKTAQNANFMCVECHTTGFKRNFDNEKNTFASYWQDLGVGCQSCHGPAAEHLQWIENTKANNDSNAAMSEYAQSVYMQSKGFTRALNAADNTQQVEICAQCHALRGSLDDGHHSSHAFMDDYLPNALTAVQYETDGKIKGEVFEYGSFVQSKMFAKGVRCSDCHNPHSGELRAEGNAVCTQCHNAVAKAIRADIDGAGLLPKNYDSLEHTHHPQGSAGAQCISCHMPGKFYMGNDFRHDHSFSTPNPANALKLKTPDACIACHENKSAKKSQAAVIDAFAKWYPNAIERDGGYAVAIKLARDGGEGAAKALQQQFARNDLPDIRRATLLAELANYPSQAAVDIITRSLQHSAPQVREAAITALAALISPQQQSPLLAPLINDPVRAVRLAATWQLLQLPLEARQGISAANWQQALDDYEQVQLTLTSRGEANLNLANLYQLTGRNDKIEPALRAALQRDPDFLPALVSLTQLLDAQGQSSQAEALLQQAMQKYPDDALLPYAYGMSLIRQGKKDQALVMLAKAAALDKNDPQYSYVYAIALHDTGDASAARKVLQALLQREPANRAARMALFDYAREARDMALMQQLLGDLYTLNPDDPVLNKNRAR